MVEKYRVSPQGFTLSEKTLCRAQASIRAAFVGVMLQNRNTRRPPGFAAKKNLASHKWMGYDSFMDVETQSARCLTPVA
ncbi:hypothetical protein QUC21_16120 [Bordetella petrii]|uniref:Transposase n=1 Tax=Bordetella petrii TaxID=94624 RepID=A0ABT7W5T1_9BORD|nr:hypothetical protein [Bordetella petrii]